MTNEEKKAIEGLKVEIDSLKVSIAGFERDIEDKSWCNKVTGELKHDILIRETILNLLKKQDNRIKELESDNYECNNIIRDYIEDWKLKTKIIDLMAEQLKTPIHSKKDVIEYFENLAKESGEIDEC